MIGIIFRFIGGLIVVAILLLVGLNSVKGTPSVQTSTMNAASLGYLEKNKDSYAKCADSVEYGVTTINDVVLENTHYGMTQTDSAKLNAIGADYMAQVKQQCSKPIADYKQNYATYKKTCQGIAKTTQSLFSKMLKNAPVVDESSLRAYDPDTVKLTSDNALDNFVFTKADVEQYFNKQLAN